MPAVASDGPGQAIPCACWRAALVKPRFALLCLHGLGLYSRSYARFGQLMSREGAVVYAIDVRGFGSWMNSDEHAQLDFDGCLHDIGVTLNSIKQADPGLPIILLGESMGGAIALRAATMYPDLICGVVSSVPSGHRFRQKRTDMKVAAEMLAGASRPRAGIAEQVVEQAATEEVFEPVSDKAKKKVNEKLAELWRSDRLDRLDLSARDLIKFQHFMDENREAIKKLHLPTLFVEGLNDELVQPKGTFELAKDMQGPRTLVALTAPHLIFEEMQACDPQTNRENISQLLGWINVHLPQAKATEGAVHALPPAADSAAPAAVLAGGKPTVVAFYADWCDQCDRVDGFIARGKKLFGRQIQFVKFNVGDPGSEPLVKAFEIGPVPSLVFLKADGTVVTSLIGESSQASVAEAMAQLLK
jgi:alpha-beta hydrolase superfamily lysophospholipase